VVVVILEQIYHFALALNITDLSSIISDVFLSISFIF